MGRRQYAVPDPTRGPRDSSATLAQLREATSCLSSGRQAGSIKLDATEAELPRHVTAFGSSIEMDECFRELAASADCLKYSLCRCPQHRA